MITYLMLLDTEEERQQLVILYECYRDALFYVANNILKEEARAEDAVHETFLKLLNYLDRIKQEDYDTLYHYLKRKEKEPGLKLSSYLEKKNRKNCHKVWSFIVTIMKNQIFDHLRIEKRRKEIPYEECMADPGVYLFGIDSMAVKQEEERYMLKGICQLPYPYKEVLCLQYYHECSSSEIGELLNKTPANIRQISKRGRDKMKQWMREGGYSL